MKSLLIFSLTLMLSVAVFAAPKVKVIKSKLGTNHDFEDKLVNGQYQYPDEATATVDDEKSLDDLVGVRKEFKDRLKQSAQRR